MNSNTAQNEGAKSKASDMEPIITNKQKQDADIRFSDRHFGMLRTASLRILTKSIPDLYETGIHRPEVHQAMLEQTEYFLDEAKLLLEIAHTACERMKAADAYLQAKSDKIVNTQFMTHLTGVLYDQRT
jgi:hypothetical protein